MRFFESAILDFFLLHLNENEQLVHMRYHLFLYYGWFLQNFAKDFIRTNMHTTVHTGEPIKITSNKEKPTKT